MHLHAPSPIRTPTTTKKARREQQSFKREPCSAAYLFFEQFLWDSKVLQFAGPVFSGPRSSVCCRYSEDELRDLSEGMEVDIGTTVTAMYEDSGLYRGQVTDLR